MTRRERGSLVRALAERRRTNRPRRAVPVVRTHTAGSETLRRLTAGFVPRRPA